MQEVGKGRGLQWGKRHAQKSVCRRQQCPGQGHRGVVLREDKSPVGTKPRQTEHDDLS